jgi:DNA primase
MPTPHREVEVGGRTVRISNPDKIYFPAIGATKGDLVDYHVAVVDGTLVGCRERPTMLHRYPDGVDGEDIYQTRVPHPAAWIDPHVGRLEPLLELAEKQRAEGLDEAPEGRARAR